MFRQVTSIVKFQWVSQEMLYWAKIIAVAAFLLTAVWACFHKTSYVFEGAPDRRAWRDLRIWAVLVMGVQTVIHLVFG